MTATSATASTSRSTTSSTTASTSRSTTSSTTAAALPTVYECPGCGERQLERRCSECNLFTRRVGPGGRCPHCEEALTLTELAEVST